MSNPVSALNDNQLFRRWLLRAALVFFLSLGMLPAQTAHAATLTVTNTNDGGVGSLRQAIANATAGDEIVLAVTGTITLSSELSIDKDITIKGPGADQLTISGDNSVRVLNISGGTVVISGVTIANGSVTGDTGAGVLVSNAANATLRYCAVTNNATVDNLGPFPDGGGIYFNSSGTLTLEYCEISNNTADFGFGGGLNIADGSSITITGSTFSGNTADEGGGIYTTVDITINGSTIADNAAINGGGGGIEIDTNTVTVRNTIVADNTDTGTGPDIWDNFGSGSFSSGGYNIIEDVGTTTFTTTTGDVTGSDPGLGTLALNSGQTHSHSISALPALNAIPSASSYNGAPTTDQRGFSRNGNYDIGAYEASGVQPEANIQGNSISITDGDSTPDLADYTDFGTVQTSGGTQDRVFTVQNTGSGNMNVLSVWIDGPHASDFIVTANPDSDVAGSSSTPFTIQFDPSADGVRTGTIYVSNNDADEHPYDFAVQGTGTSAVSATYIYLPLVLKDFSFAPDLVITDLVATSSAISVTIRNAGTAAVTDPFWVDVYFDPTETPGLNKPWSSIAPAGAVWGVTAPIPAGDSLTLTVGDAYYASQWSSPSFPTGAQVYAYVDSINYETSYGNVQESNEGNNLSNPVTSTAGQGKLLIGGQGQTPSTGRLPMRE